MKHDNTAAQAHTEIAHDFKDIGNLVKDAASESFSDAAVPFTKRANEFRKMATKAVQHVAENAADYYDQGVQKAKKIEKSLEKSVKSHPAAYALAGAGIALLASALFLRRKK